MQIVSYCHIKASTSLDHVCGTLCRRLCNTNFSYGKFQQQLKICFFLISELASHSA